MIADGVAARKEKSDKIDALLQKCGDTGEALDAADEEVHDTLAAEIVTIDKSLERFRAAEKREKDAAVLVVGRTPTEAAESRGTTRITVEKKLPAGIAFARYAMCMGMARGDEYRAKQIATDNYGDDAYGLIKLIDLQQKGAVGAANTQTAGWASELIPYTERKSVSYVTSLPEFSRVGLSGVGLRLGAVPYRPPRTAPPMAIMIPPAPWSVPRLPFSEIRRPNSENWSISVLPSSP